MHGVTPEPQVTDPFHLTVEEAVFHQLRVGRLPVEPPGGQQRASGGVTRLVNGAVTAYAMAGWGFGLDGIPA